VPANPFATAATVFVIKVPRAMIAPSLHGGQDIGNAEQV
jgi:hypothetical protein